MNRKLLTYGPVVLLALLCAAAFATGALTRYPVLEAQVQAMDFPNGTAVSLENGDVYGVVPSGGPGHSLSAGTYRLKWFVDGDGDNALHLYSENGVKMEPETVILPAGQFEGEFEFTLDSAISGLQLQFEFAAGTYMEIYDVRIYTPGCSDNAFTLLFASLAFSLIWVAVRRGRLRTAQIEGMLMIGLAVLFASAPAFQETLHIGDDIQYHLCRIENIVDAWRAVSGTAGRVYVRRIRRADLCFLSGLCALSLRADAAVRREPCLCGQHAAHQPEHRRGGGHVCGG